MAFIKNSGAQTAGFLFFFLLSILSASTLLTITTGQGQQSNALCSNQVCITATIFSKDPNTVEFSLFSKIAVGWLGVGVGGSPNSMPGNDIAICWPNATGTGAVISQRSATVNGAPSPLATVGFRVQQAKSGITSSTQQFTCTFSRPLNLTTSPISAASANINVIYAVGLVPVKPAPSKDPQQAAIVQHTYTGHGSLTIVKKQGSSLDKNNTITIPPPPKTGGGNSGNSTGGNGNQDADTAIEAQERYDRLVKVHGVLMAIAFLIIFPTGALLVRFFAEVHSIFRWHRPLQITGFLMVVAGIGCILGAVYSQADGAPEITETGHSLLGVILVSALVIQICVGIFIFNTYDPSATVQRMVHRVTTIAHRCWGYTILIVGAIQVKLGLDRYGMWPTGMEAIWYIFYVWVGIVAAVFVFGSVIKMLRGRKAAVHDNHYPSNGKDEFGSR